MAAGGFAMKSAGPVIGAILLVLLTLLLIYVASLGPALLLHSHGMLNEDVGEAIYTPLVWAANSTAVIETPLSYYVSLWVPEDPPPAPIPAPIPAPAGS
jgi:hypothetical protein